MNKKIEFIMCVNDDLYAEECAYYIRKLEVPEGYSIDILTIRDADFITGAYNAAMHASDAKYKVYLHQDVFLLNKTLIQDMLDIFSDESIGMIGVLGTDKYPLYAKFSSCWNIGATYACNSYAAFMIDKNNKQIENVVDVVAIDGMFMATQYDVEWNENLRGWHFYDASQSIAFRERGYRVVVPHQAEPWMMHDAGFCSENGYDAMRKEFCREYQRLGFCYKSEDDSKYQSIQTAFMQKKAQLFDCINRGDISKIKSALQEASKILDEDTDVTVIETLFEIYDSDMKTKGCSDVFYANDWEFEKNRYNYIKFLLRRAENGFVISEFADLLELLREQVVSDAYVRIVAEHSLLYKGYILEAIQRALDCGRNNRAVETREETKA